MGRKELLLAAAGVILVVAVAVAALLPYERLCDPNPSDTFFPVATYCPGTPVWVRVLVAGVGVALALVVASVALRQERS